MASGTSATSRGPAVALRIARHPAAVPVLFLLLILVLAGCTDDEVRDAQGTVVAAGDWSVFDLHVGDCLDPDAELTGEISEIAVVPCSEPHSQEVFASVEHPPGPYPGAQAASFWADGACLGALDETLGLTLDDGVFVSYLLPTFDGWNKHDDRRATCVLVFPDRENAVGSVVAGTMQIDRVASVLPSPVDPGDEADEDGGVTGEDVEAAGEPSDAEDGDG